MAYADWSSDDYENFHDASFIEVFNSIDFGYISDDQMERLEELFEAGWLNFEISEEERRQYREDFQNEANYELTREQWDTWRELYDQTNG